MIFELAVILSWCIQSVVAQGNTTCKGTTLDWYTSVVKETPCMWIPHLRVDHLTKTMIGTTYQRLRQICNSNCTYYCLTNLDDLLSPFRPSPNSPHDYTT